MELRITTLIEDTQDEKKEYLHEHGLSMYIECYGKRILFDTGQTGAAVENAGRMGKSLKDIDDIIISHGHYDHSGGLKEVMKNTVENTSIYIGKEFFRMKYKKNDDGKYYYRGNDFTEQDIRQANMILHQITDDITYINDNIIIFKNFKKYNNYEIIPSKFVVEENMNYIPDDFPEEISLGIITSRGLVIITGCSHAGIINIVKTISDRVNIPVYAVVGGTHLTGADDERISNTLKEFRNLKVKKIAVSHCTGDQAVKRIKEEFKTEFINNNTGNIIEF